MWPHVKHVILDPPEAVMTAQRLRGRYELAILSNDLVEWSAYLNNGGYQPCSKCRS